MLFRSRLVLLHSGILYATPDRDPTTFFKALGALKREGRISGESLKVILRASGYEELYRSRIHEADIEDIVQLAPAVGYQEALKEMLTVEGLLLFQGHDSNPAIPAKLYEYLRARRPIFAMVDSAGETAQALRATGVGTIVPLDSQRDIEVKLGLFIEGIQKGTNAIASDETIRLYSRQVQAQQLAHLFDQVVGAPKSL